MKRRFLTALLLILPAPVAAESNHLLHTEQLEGVYTQDWWGRELGNRDGTGFEVYVTGEGKRGDFNGVLSVDCANPQFSRWLSTGGYLPPDSVPIEAIRGVRNLACDR